MAHSAIRFHNGQEYILDSVLEILLNDIKTKLVEKFGSLNEKHWLVDAYKKWEYDCENMPPGLKDLDFDLIIINDKKRDEFITFIHDIKNNNSHKSVVESCDRILKLFS